MYCRNSILRRKQSKMHSNALVLFIFHLFHAVRHKDQISKVSLYEQITFRKYKRGREKRLRITSKTVALKNSASFSSNFLGTIPYRR